MAEFIVKTDGDGWGTKAGELIRCKDCKYYLQLEDDIGECRLTDSFFTCEISINDYCSRGERREETEC